jgi:ubiquinone/menaquinone biosynthesis C-methylase UbiE
MNMKGDTERQATLRNEMIKSRRRTAWDNYISRVSSIVKHGMMLLDIGCGTAHIIEKLATRHRKAVFVGLDVSPAMLRIAKSNTEGLPNVVLVEGDGSRLPFPSGSFNVMITRLAEYSPEEAYRVLKKGGFFFEYDLGPEANKEIAEFFQDRIEEENFFSPSNFREWKQEVCEKVVDAGFLVESVEDYKEKEYYKNVEKLMNLIEMVPLVKNFDRERDRKTVEALAKRYWSKRGIQITWHYYILTARRF